MYINGGAGFERNIEEGIKLYSKYQKLNPDKAAETLGNMRLVDGDAHISKGEGVAAKLEFYLGIELLKKAASWKNRGAKFKLGEIYAEGKYAEKNIPAAIKCFKSAAKCGHPHAREKWKELRHQMPQTKTVSASFEILAVIQTQRRKGAKARRESPSINN